MIAVSVVITTRNRRRFLSEALAAVRAQSIDDWEVIVVDDASTDDTPSFLRDLHDPRVSWIRNDPQAGPSTVLNLGLAKARGKYVMFLDDDDLLRFDTLERLRGALEAQPHAVSAAGSCRIFFDDGDSVRPYRPARAYTRVMWREFLFGWWSNSGQNLHRTAIVRELGGFDTAVRNVHDRKLWLHLSLRGPICVVPEVAMEYRQHPSQTSKSPGIPARRAALWLEFIEQLPAARQAAARRVRRSADLAELARTARLDRRFAAALLLQARACVTTPSLLLSPFLARPLWWELKKSLLRSSAP
jgi:glycosyltransferase involved in cell wall biosynthesis